MDLAAASAGIAEISGNRGGRGAPGTGGGSDCHKGIDAACSVGPFAGGSIGPERMSCARKLHNRIRYRRPLSSKQPPSQAAGSFRDDRTVRPASYQRPRPLEHARLIDRWLT